MSASTSDRESRRKESFKSTAVDGRRKREEKRVQIRKTKKSARLKKRRVGLRLDSSPDASLIPQLCRDLHIPAQQLTATTAFRCLLSREEAPPIDAVLRSGAAAQFVRFLTHSDPRLQVQAAWALTNIASGTSEHVSALLELGALEGFVHLLQSSHEEVREQCMWGIGNIAGDCVEHRDRVLRTGVLGLLLASITPQAHVAVLRTATWALSNFCRGKPAPSAALLAPAVPVLAQLTRSTDTSVLIDAMWALSYLTDGNDEQIEHIVSFGFVPSVVALLTHHNLMVQVPAVRIVGNIVSGHEALTQTILDANAVLPLRQGLDSRSKSLRKEVCWALSNIAAGTAGQIQQLLAIDIVPAVQALPPLA